jgi:uncharacterized protein YceH (UPF0502 family)
MSSRFNVLLHGGAEEAANELRDTDATPDELRVALINALERINRLEDEVSALRRQVPDNR